MAWKVKLPRIGGRRLAEGVNLVLYSLVVIAIIVLANWFVNRHNQRWDLTPSKKYSLSPQSLKIVKDLDRDLTIYVFDRERGFRARRDLLDMYESASRRVTARYVDPDRQPALAKQYSVRSYGTLVVTAGGRQFETQTDTEEAVTNAIIRVLKGQKSACFLQGHGEKNPESSEREGLDKLKKALEGENYQVKSVTLLQKLEIPSDCSLVVVAGPQNDYEAPEVEIIKKFVTGGGRALMMLDAGTDFPNLAKLLGEWNVTVRNDLVIDLNPLAQIFGTRPYMPLVLKYGSSPIVQPLERTATMFPVTRSFEVGKDYKAGVNAESLCETSSESHGMVGFNAKMKEVSLEFRSGKDVKGPLSVAVSGTLSGTGSDNKAEGRFVALGTSLLATNSFLSFQGNRDLVMNMVNWLSSEEGLISVRPKPPESQQLNLTARQMSKILYAGVFGLPLVIIILGFMVWWRRR